MKKIIVLLCVILSCLSACAKENPVKIEYSNSDARGLLRSVLIDKSTIESIYQLDSDAVLDDIVLINI